MSRVTDPNQVRLTGENSFITLSAEEKGPATTRASHWRVLLSPAGHGHALFLQSELTEQQVRVYADNVSLARWLQEEARQPGGDQKSAVIQATFAKSGDATSSWTETVRSNSDVITLSWYDFGEPFIFRSDAGSRPGIIHGVYSCLIPARNAEVTLNEKIASGRPFPQQLDERTSSTACLAWSETWLRPY